MIEPTQQPDPANRWLVGIGATMIAGLMLGGWASASSATSEAAKRIAALEATTIAAERRVSGIESQLIRIEAKLDRALEKR